MKLEELNIGDKIKLQGVVVHKEATSAAVRVLEKEPVVWLRERFVDTLTESDVIRKFTPTHVILYYHKFAPRKILVMQTDDGFVVDRNGKRFSGYDMLETLEQYLALVKEGENE